jgi:hypothetical protein
MASAIRTVKVFSANRSRDREALGERVSSWIRDHPEAHVLKTTVVLSSDRQFHCLSIVLICGTR